MASEEYSDNRQMDGLQPDLCRKTPVTHDRLRKDLEYAQQEIERNVYDELDDSSISTRDSNQIDAIPGFADDRTKPCKHTFKDPDYAYIKGIMRGTGDHGLMICIPKEVISKFVKQEDGKHIHVRSLIGVCQLVNVQVEEDLPENRVWVEMTAKRKPTEHQYSSTLSMGTVQSAQYARGQIYRTENEPTRRSPVQHSDDNKDDYQTLKFEYVAPAGSIIVDDILKHQKVADFLLDKTNDFDLKLTQWEYDYEAPVLLERFLWYHKDIDHREAKQRLNGKEVGTFLVRQAASGATADPNHKFTMEIVRKDKKIIRLRIMHRDGLYNFEDSKQKLNEFTNYLTKLLSDYFGHQ
ncbi:uncharacterized protein LOC128212391 isoform X2 [Mya arenaria]|uniref:uncharacterized protein LOC128212391 isoform X2 n=1 Tax=Mya arenaria TaxID=6604 RepID=UPI0022E4E604|nr:uncharacterized protein LOC128212391 isoform X2 [Mya arenaria]